MNPYIPFETALVILTMAYVVPLMFLLVVSNVAIAAIETLEGIGD